jgi:hypothetical protein
MRTRDGLSLPICFILFVMVQMLGIPNVSFAKPPEPAAACAAPEYRQFDFWVGDWDAFEAGSRSPVARAHVDRILDGCVLREDYQDTAGLKGQSFTIYDATRRVWHQSWVTNRGRLLTIEGRLEGNEIILTGKDRTADGKERLVRGTWQPISAGVRETAVTSTDQGNTWQQWFDIEFRPHKP